MTRTPDEMRADAERALALIVEELPKPDFVAAARTAVPALASDVLSLLAERDATVMTTTYAHGVRAGLISAAEYLEHEAVLAKGDLRTGLYNSAALVCRSRAQVAAPEAEDEIAKLRAEVAALKEEMQRVSNRWSEQRDRADNNEWKLSVAESERDDARQVMAAAKEWARTRAIYHKAIEASRSGGRSFAKESRAWNDASERLVAALSSPQPETQESTNE